MSTSSRAWGLAIALLAACVADNIEHDGDSESGSVTNEEDFPQRMAEAYCTALFACDPLATCGEFAPPYANEAECAAKEQDLLEQVRDSAQAADLTYDAACVEATIGGYQAKGCDTYERLRIVDPHALDQCPPYYGTIPEGENPCFEVVGSALSECGSGLVCEEAGGSCKVHNKECLCDDGFGCNHNSNFFDICVPQLELGAECEAFADVPMSVCGRDAYCQSGYDVESMMALAQICIAQKPLGAPCGYYDECTSYACDGTCQPGQPALCSDAPRHWR